MSEVLDVDGNELSEGDNVSLEAKVNVVFNEVDGFNIQLLLGDFNEETSDKITIPFNSKWVKKNG